MVTTPNDLRLRRSRYILVLDCILSAVKELDAKSSSSRRPSHATVVRLAKQYGANSNVTFYEIDRAMRMAPREWLL